MNLINKKVSHKKYGEGIVKNQTEGKVEILFDKDMISFPLSAFGTFLSMEDDELMREIRQRAAEIEKTKKEEKARLQAEKAVQSNPAIYRKDTIKLGEAFNTHIEAINECFGLKLKALRIGWKDIVCAVR